MTKLYLDTEFNGFNGKLMSMALVPEDDSLPEFYKEIEFTGQLDPWVKENVVPHMFLLPCTYTEFQNALAQYLFLIGECTIVADWPDDIRYFCEALITGPGEMLPTAHKVQFELNRGIDYVSYVPHNALWDARGIKTFFKGKQNEN
jgi:hypothetical protein